MAKVRGKAIFDEDRCKGCELCTYVCPVNIIVMDNRKINKRGYHPAMVINMDKCLGCANCAIMCPDTVIKVEREFVSERR
jgi:2-oxoglutarate ferredoxin oxidoreductase subunit delta